MKRTSQHGFGVRQSSAALGKAPGDWRSPKPTGSRRSQRGVALVVTLILLSVITFMTITFLVISRREKGSVTTTTDQNIARLAADAALERAKAQMLAPMLAFTNKFALDFLVSTNFINRAGFFPGVSHPTNVNYDWRWSDGQPLNRDDLLQNITNLFYDPRVPVFVRTNRTLIASNDFRFYLDLNRNGKDDANGLLPVIGVNGGFLHPDGTENSSPVNVVTNYFVGDPEWIGVLERPELRHAANNKFVSRYAYAVVPLSKALDLNYIHNQAKRLQMQTLPGDPGFYRNQGIGTWEINLAAFLADLNTNQWCRDNTYYQYNPDPGQLDGGRAFYSAFELLRYRYGGDFTLLTGWRPPFDNPSLDEYANGPLMTGTVLNNDVNDNDAAYALPPPRTTYPGADNPNHFFTPQDLFDTNKTSIDFTDRLLTAGTNASSYNRYTFYRLMSQLGTESAPENPEKINVNYVNVGGLQATNFVPWSPIQFFTNAVEKLLRLNTNYVGIATNGVIVTANALSITNIPIYPVNFYTPNVHRLLQLVANIYDATTNRISTAYPFLPTVFRPRFGRDANNNVYIVGYTTVETVTDTADPQFSIPLDLNNPADVGKLSPSAVNDVNVFGVPWVIGAKKGLPNFNEFAMQSVSQITRKLQITRPSVGAPRSQWKTNQMFVIGISNVIGVEVWNSYRTNYARPVDIYVTDFLSMMLTNDIAGGKQWSLPQPIMTIGAQLSLPNATNSVWPGYSGKQLAVDPSFQVPLRTNIVFLPDSIYQSTGNKFLANLSQPYETGVGFPQPQWRLAITNKLRFIMVDRASGRVIDYVQLSGLNDYRNLSDEVKTTGYGFDGLWNTNRVGGNSINNPPEGIIWQIQVSLGNVAVPPGGWRSYGTFPSGVFPGQEIADCKAFYSPNHRAVYTDPEIEKTFTAYNTNLFKDVPFCPVRKISKYWSWQANDPLVHYTAGDLLYLDITNSLRYESPGASNITTLENIGRVNNRYAPWGRNEVSTDPDTFNLALKDPLVRMSDDWDFPTNKLPNIGWLGRVHRGTPWQTVYLKATNILSAAKGLNTWMHWTGNMNGEDAKLAAPVQDRLIFDLFTTAPNDNASRGQLSVNQTGLAAWSAVLSGVVVLTNMSADSALITATPTFGWTNIAPAGLDGPSSQLWQLVNGPNGINAVRANTSLFPGGVFGHLGDILAAPALTEKSPFLNQSTAIQMQKGISDEVYERIPQQILSLLRGDDKPRFAVYAYGQALKPADGSIVTSGPFFGLCTNYQITAEVVTRAVVRVDGDPDPARGNDPDPQRRYPPRVVIESFNFLPPD